MKKSKAIKAVIKENIEWCRDVIETLQSHNAPKDEIEYYEGRLYSYEDMLNTIEKL